MYGEVEKDQRKENKNLMNFQIIKQTGVSLEKQFQRSNHSRNRVVKSHIVLYVMKLECNVEQKVLDTGVFLKNAEI